MEYEKSIVHNARTISEYTFETYERLWFENLSQNLPEIWYGGNLKTLIEENFLPHSEYGLVIGAGPSLQRFKHLELVSKSGFDGVIIICDRILKPCLEKGIESHLVVSIDGTEKVSEFFDEVQLRNQVYPKTLLSVFIHPKTVKNVKLTGSQIYWFITNVDDPKEKKSLTRVVYWMTNGMMIVPGLGNVGAMCWNIACLLGCKKVGMIGLDYGYPLDTRFEDTVYYKAYVKLAEMNNKPLEKFYKVIENPLGRKVLTSLNWDVYRYIFTTFSDEASKRFGVKTYNLCPDSSLFSESIEYVDLESFLKKEV